MLPICTAASWTTISPSRISRPENLLDLQRLPAGERDEDLPAWLRAMDLELPPHRVRGAGKRCEDREVLHDAPVLLAVRLQRLDHDPGLREARADLVPFIFGPLTGGERYY